MTVVYGVWSGEYSYRTLHALFPTEEMAQQYIEDLPVEFLFPDRYDIEPEDLYADRAEWMLDLQERRQAAEERQARVTAAEAVRREQMDRAVATAEQRRALIDSVVPTPHRLTNAEIDAEVAAEREASQ